MSESDEDYAYELCHAALGDDDNGFAVMIRVYMDESGTHDGSPVVTVGAYAGKPKTWRSFERQWNVAKRPIKIFHSTDCAAFQGEFKGWTEKDRDKLVAGLLPILADHELYGEAIGINVNDFNQATDGKRELPKIFGSVYEFCFQTVISNVIYQMEQHGLTDSLAFIHEENDYQQAALNAFDWVKERRKKHASGMSITFAPKNKVVSLQAADVLAFEANKRLRDQDRPMRRSFIAMDPDGDRLHIAGIDKRNVQAAIDRLTITAKELRLLGRSVDVESHPWLKSGTPFQLSPGQPQISLLPPETSSPVPSDQALVLCVWACDLESDNGCAWQRTSLQFALVPRLRRLRNKEVFLDGEVYHEAAPSAQRCEAGAENRKG